jgi:orotidine-5'-phosphate decarboxylase
MNHNPIIIALDVDSAAEARRLVATLGPCADFYKVGMELYAAAGMDFVRELQAQGKMVFLDLKMYDIPETVKRAMALVAAAGVRFSTVHAVGQVMRAAHQARAGSALQLLAVTVLTSFGPPDVEEQGYTCAISELVERRARNAIAAGMDGIVSSPLEAAAIRRIAGPQAIIVTPGVRSAGASVADQKRVATPAEAVRNGADYLVIGRQITRAANPAAEFARVMEEIRG